MSAEPRIVSRSARVLVALATLAAVFCIASLVYGVTRVPLVRDVAFSGVDHRSGPACHGPALWNGERAWVACDWRHAAVRTLVEFDPETARATVLHSWSLADGGTAALQVVRPCPDGLLFVVGEMEQTTLITRRGAELRADHVDIPGEVIRGARCRDTGVDIFLEEVEGYAVVQFDGAARQHRPMLRADEAPGLIVGAWFEADAWHAIYNDWRTSALLAGKLGETPARIDGVPPGSRVCAIGEPGGWLVTAGPRCDRGIAVHRDDGAFRLTPIDGPLEALTVHAHPVRGFGMTLDELGVTAFRGLGALDLELRRRRDSYEVQRGGGAPVEIGRSRWAFHDGAFALPLSGDRVALWGSLGNQRVILGPDLRRVDTPGLDERLTRPLHHVQASARHVADGVFYIVLLFASPVWLIAFIALRGRRPRPSGLVVAAGVYVLLFLCGAQAYLGALAWI